MYVVVPSFLNARTVIHMFGELSLAKILIIVVAQA